MRRIIGTIGLVAVVAAVGVAIVGLGDDTQTYQGTVDPAQARGASAELEVSDDGAVIVADQLPAPEQGQVYQAWFKRPGSDRPEPTSTLFRPRGDGSATAVVTGDLDGVETVLVTSEPKAGSNEPSGQPVLTMPLSQASHTSDGAQEVAYPGGRIEPSHDPVPQPPSVGSSRLGSPDEQRSQFVYFPRKSSLELLMRSARL